MKSMKSWNRTACVGVLATCLFALPSATINAADAAPPSGGKLLLSDSFDREEADPAMEQIGNDWGTNSKSRAKGNKQVDLVDGAMHITRHPVADHGVSVTHEVSFRDATIQLRFKLGEKDDLGINIADMNEKSVHAGHICVARVRLTGLEMTDLKTGPMNLQNREARLNNSLTAAQKALIKSKTKNVKLNLTPDQWHDLQVQIKDDTMRVSVDGEPVGEFQSPGIGHETKSRLRLAVNKSAWVDDVKVWDSAE
ncbi:family 16 glycoside hydrolase [Stieleria varia]|uniref:3-keto-alpha-glucoside-1,2-lyase/3-keto-2-hydroxy-glucal hydratase domain-containing protein n=1 Tax=Stieleria varia TaxID=2528005 RepID=A0A5C6A228_9BACT|nr:family 16 glycoside hydrolase [Stieleria varia]TWT93914.1 hypothetical protein Pla52n_57420 [Stieleria varia]